MFVLEMCIFERQIYLGLAHITTDLSGGTKNTQLSIDPCFLNITRVRVTVRYPYARKHFKAHDGMIFVVTPANRMADKLRRSTGYNLKGIGV